MAASCINVSIGAASLLAGRFATVQAISTCQTVRHGVAAPCASVSCSNSSVERKFVFGFGFETPGSRAGRNGGVVARAVELDENKDGILVASAEDDSADVPTVEESPQSPLLTASCTSATCLGA
ncbi:hypothetical protein R1flu_011410 [Riccia fluitans]|uniref:Uncharacterized protein n=1 Tax=Riccia fluitans TaxID=41844 RepID=A0ABD1Z7Z0_9MARC